MLSELRRFSASQLLILGAILLILVIISFSFADIISSSTIALFIFLILVMIFLTLVLVRSAYPKTSPFDVEGPVSIVDGREQRKNTEEWAPSFSELRRIFINRVQLRRGVSGARWASIKSNRKALSHLVGDEDLVDLIMLDEARFAQKGDRMPLSREEFEKLLTKVEEWR